MKWMTNYFGNSLPPAYNFGMDDLEPRFKRLLVMVSTGEYIRGFLPYQDDTWGNGLLVSDRPKLSRLVLLGLIRRRPKGYKLTNKGRKYVRTLKHEGF